MATADKVITFNSVAASGGSAPAWFTAMPEKTWATPVTNTLSAVGAPPAVCTAYTGACVNQAGREYLMVANGGHTDYAGNETYALSLGVSSPAWVRLYAPSTAQTGDVTNTQNGYADGKPRSVHGWARSQFANGRVYYAGLDGCYNNGTYTSACWSMNRSTLVWTYHGLALPSLAGQSREGGCAVYDRVTGIIWSLANYANDNGGFSWNTANNALTPQPSWYFPEAFGGGWAVITHNTSPRCLIASTGQASRLWVLNLENVAAGWVQRTPSGSGVYIYAGGMYHAPSQAVFCWHNNGANILKLSVPANPYTGSYAWSTVSPAVSNSITPVTPPSPASAGTFSKFNIIEDMGNGQAAFVLTTSTVGQTYVYKLPAGALS